MRVAVLTLALAGLAPAAASAAPFGEPPFTPVSGEATCLRATGVPGELVRWTSTGARLEEADQHLLAQAVLSEDVEVSRDDVVAAMGSMRRSEDTLLRGQLKARIGESERAGNFEEALRLTLELQGLERPTAGRRGPC